MNKELRYLTVAAFRAALDARVLSDARRDGRDPDVQL